MTEQEAMNKIQALVLGRRKYLGIAYSGYCSKCHNIDARYLTSSVVNGTSECEECFIKRKYSELAPQITEEDSSEIKAQRAQKVREYFNSRKCLETFTDKYPGLVMKLSKLVYVNKTTQSTSSIEQRNNQYVNQDSKFQSILRFHSDQAKGR